MRFWDPKTSAFDIEATLVMNVVAGPPSAWQLSPIEGDAGATVSVADDGTWSVKCGQEFTLALELSDEFGNRCTSLHGWVPVIGPNQEFPLVCRVQFGKSRSVLNPI